MQERSLLFDLKPTNAEKVTFGDGAARKILGKGKLNFQGNDVMLVKGLTSNLISISQLCDQGLNMSFTKDQCVVTDDVNALVMIDTRSLDNYYLWNPEKCFSVLASLKTRRR